MPNTGTVRATLSAGAVVCTVRRDEPFDDQEWIAVRQLAEAVRACAAVLDHKEAS